jgi:hypothetical protein
MDIYEVTKMPSGPPVRQPELIRLDRANRPNRTRRRCLALTLALPRTLWRFAVAAAVAAWFRPPPAIFGDEIGRG